MENLKTAHKLVTIREVNKIEPIVGADLIVLVKIGGWSVIAKKDEFQVGDKGVLFEVDSFIPFDEPKINPYIQFLEKDKREYMGKQGIRIKTKKIRGALSQGLFLPLGLFPELSDKENGDEVTDYFNVIKYDNTISGGNTSGTQSNFATVFPFYIKKTDCERIQNFGMAEVLNKELMTSPMEVTVKYDGTSSTVYVNDNQDLLSSMNFFNCKFIDEEKRGIIPEIHVGLCSRNQEVAPTETSVYVIEPKKNKLKEILLDYHKEMVESNSELPKNIAIQSEIIGKKINGNFEGLKDQNEMHIFNVYDIDNGEYVDYDKRQAIISKLNEIAVKYGVTLNTVKLAENVPQNKSLLDMIGVSVEQYEQIVGSYIEKKQTINAMRKEYNADHDKINELVKELQPMQQVIYNELTEKVQNFLLEKADGAGYKNNKREGIVAKSHNGKFIFKAISNAYLLKFEK